eukprot:gene26365-31364_t
MAAFYMCGMRAWEDSREHCLAANPLPEPWASCDKPKPCNASDYTFGWIACSAFESGMISSCPLSVQMAVAPNQHQRTKCLLLPPHGRSMIFGEPWRQCFERVIETQASGTWGGVSSQDVVHIHGGGVGGTGGAGDSGNGDISGIEHRYTDISNEFGGEAISNSYRVYTPTAGVRDKNTLLPVLVYLHGGGHTISHVHDRQYDELARELAAKGPYVVVVPEYRLAPEHPYPAAVVDSLAAMRWAYHTDHPGLATYAGNGGDRTIIVGGDSAGGNLAAVLALLARDHRDAHGNAVPKHAQVPVAHQLLVYPSLYPETKTDSSEMLGEDAMFIPPVARLDPLYSEGKTYGSLLRQAGVAVFEYEDMTMPHGFFAFATLNLKEMHNAIDAAVENIN